MGKVVPLLTDESRIKRRLRRHLKNLGFVRSSKGLLLPPANSKEAFRALHSAQRRELICTQGKFLEKRYSDLAKYFADGSSICPEKIAPRLEQIRSETWQAYLFRLASLTWSIPVSPGFGRRMRFLVWDDYNGKLIGLIALGDPVFNLKSRDQWIGWSGSDRNERLVNVLDAYVLGAIPPYSQLLCGKMLACLIRTREIYDAFSDRYGNAKGIISGKSKNARLALVTTSSALGRSSVYNRLKLEGTRYFEPIGYTSGWGHFHIPNDLYEEMREFLSLNNHPYADGHEFGQGPSWRLRVIKKTLELVGLNPDLMKHGISRQVFACCLASNAKRFLRGDVSRADSSKLKSVSEVAEMARTRWIEPRAQRRPGYSDWDSSEMIGLIRNGTSSADLFATSTDSITEDRKQG